MRLEVHAGQGGEHNEEAGLGGFQALGLRACCLPGPAVGFAQLVALSRDQSGDRRFEIPVSEISRGRQHPRSDGRSRTLCRRPLIRTSLSMRSNVVRILYSVDLYHLKLPAEM